MQRIKLGLTAHVTNIIGAALGTIIVLVCPADAQAQTTNLAVTVRHAPGLNGNGRIEGSLQQMLGEGTTLNGGFTLTGDLLVPEPPRCAPTAIRPLPALSPAPAALRRPDIKSH